MTVLTEPNLNLKFLESASPEERRAVIQHLSKLGATSVKRLFPRDGDPELASFYLVAAPARIAKRAIAQLQGHPAVDFIAEQPVRKVMGPGRGLAS